jgi:hypothetical protein
MKKLLKAAALLILPMLASAQYTDVINSNRPGKSMGTFSVGKTVIQAESGLYYTSDKHDVLHYDSKGYGIDMDVRYGAFLEQLEFILNLEYQHDKFSNNALDEKRNGLRQMTIGAKYLVYDPNKNYEKKPNLYSWKANHTFNWHEFVPSVGVYGGINLNLFDSPFIARPEKWTPKGMIMTQNQFGKWVLVINFIADDLISDYMSLGYIVTVTRGFNEKWSGFLENQGISGDYYSDGIFRGGAAYLLKENMQIDASVGQNIKNTPSIFTASVGFSWRFDANYQDVILRAPKQKEDKKSKAEKKKEKEAKKRKDAIENNPVDTK